MSALPYRKNTDTANDATRILTEYTRIQIEAPPPPRDALPVPRYLLSQRIVEDKRARRWKSEQASRLARARAEEARHKRRKAQKAARKAQR